MTGSFKWLDPIKGYITNALIDLLDEYILNLSIESDLIIKLAEQILVFDPVN